MHASASQLIASLRSSFRAQQVLLAQATNSFVQTSRHFSNYVPLYEASKTIPYRTRLTPSISNNLVWCRCANTSSGNYASSTLPCADQQINHRQATIQSVFEDSDRLPALPVPQLNDTLEKLKTSIAPVVMNTAEFVSTLQLIDEFAKTAGPKLDMLLRNKAKQTKNWLTHDWWTSEVYMKQRQPLVINSNPAMMYPEFPFESPGQQGLLKTISLLISGVIDFKLSLLAGYNPEGTNSTNEYHLDENLCYNQYKRIFGATRIPGELIDSMKLKDDHQVSPDTPFDLVISYHGRYFQVQLYDVENEDSRLDKLSTTLNKIILDTTLASDEQHSHPTGAGVLTTARRSDWAQTYKLLDEESMEAIQDAQFMVCLDTIAPRESDDIHSGLSSGSEDMHLSSTLLTSKSGSQEYMSALSRHLLHADSDNVDNRWFDKSLQLIIVSDDKTEKLLGAGFNYEHSQAEASVVTKLIEYSYDKTVQKNREASNLDSFTKQTLPIGGGLFSSQRVASKSSDSVNNLVQFRQLRMFKDDSDSASKIPEALRKAKQDFQSQVDQFDLIYFKYRNYGSNAIKSWHFSPDSWFQVALQWAYYNTHKRLGTCYETASTRRFAYGRTETIRSLSEEVAQFCTSPNYDTMHAAIKAHKRYSNDAVNGLAVDRALMGYRMTFHELLRGTWKWGIPDGAQSSSVSWSTKLRALNNQQPGQQQQLAKLEDLFSEKELSVISAFFNSELIKRSFKFSLSTSQVSSIHADLAMSFGPLLADGYGCCYNITGQQIVAAITANSSNQSFSCDTDKVHDRLTESLDRMYGMIERKKHH